MEDFFDIHLKKRGDQCTCPGSCARKRDSHKQQKSQKFISLDLVTLSHSSVFQLCDQTSERLCFFHPFKDLPDKKQDKRNRNNISHDTDRQCLRSRYLQQRSCQKAARSSSIGIIEMMNTAPSGEINCARWCENHCTSTSIVPP